MTFAFSSSVNKNTFSKWDLKYQINLVGHYLSEVCQIFFGMLLVI